MTLLELFSVPFMQRALIAAFLVGIAAPAVGTYIVQRRLALMGDGIGHVAVTGVAIGLWTQTSPTWAAVVVAIAGAVVIEVVRERGHAEGDVALAMLFYGGLAGGIFVIVFLSLVRGSGNHRPLILATVLLLAVVGALDEWHQTFTPGRSGNDPLDWLADVLGAFAGATAGLRLRQTLLR